MLARMVMRLGVGYVQTRIVDPLREGVGCKNTSIYNSADRIFLKNIIYL